MREPIKMPLGGLTHVGPTNDDIRRGQEWINSLFAAMRDEEPATQPFAKVHWTLVIIISMGSFMRSLTSKESAWSNFPSNYASTFGYSSW